MGLRFEDLPPSTQKHILKQEMMEERNEESTTKAVEKAKDSITTKAHAVIKKPIHVQIMWLSVGTFAYVLLGMGWFIGAIGDCVYEVGQRAHQAKWRIE